jgi:hypothetical protein
VSQGDRVVARKGHIAHTGLQACAFELVLMFLGPLFACGSHDKSIIPGGKSVGLTHHQP